MKSFRFSLEPALRWRRTQLAGEEETLARLLQRRQELERDLAAVETAKFQATQQNAPATGSDFQMIARYLVGLNGRRADLTMLLATADAACRTQQALCLEAQRRVELLKSLRSKRHQEWSRQEDLELESLAADAYLAKLVRER